MNNLKKLIIYNEISGKGNASKVCYNLLLPNIQQNIIQIYPCDEYSFINQSHMIRNDFKKMLNKNNYDVIIILGGDGTVHSLINNLVELDIINKPICHIPCGTGNGLSKSVYYSKFKDYYEPFNIKNVINKICEYETCKVNIFKIKSIGENNYIEKYGFLSLTWGIFSEIDIKTEWMRRIGSFRNTLGAIWELIRKQSYHGTISYKNEDDTWTTITDNFYYFTASNVSHVCEDVFISPDIKLDDGYFHLGILRGNNVSRYTILKLLLSFSSGTCDKYLEVIHTTHFKIKIDAGIVVLDGEQIVPDYKEFEVEMSDKQITIF